jgi:hypothetical protein
MRMGAGRRRRLTVVLVLVVVLAAVLVAADRGAAWYAERRLAEETATWATRAGAEPGTEPAVHVEGFPFLDQVVRGRYDGVAISVRDVGTGGLIASRLDIHLTGVDLPFADLTAGDLSHAHADRVTATAHIPLSEFQTALSPRGVKLRVQSGRLRVEVPFEIAGFKSTVSGLADVEAAGGRLRLRLTDLAAAGAPLPQSAADAVSRQLASIIEAPKLPYGLVLDQVRVTPAGLVATASGRNVSLSS